MTRESYITAEIPAWKRTAAAIAAGLGTSGLLLSGCTPAENPPPAATATEPAQPTHETSEPAGPLTPETLNAETEWIPERGDYLAPENLVDLTSEEITEAFTIYEGDIESVEDFIRLDTYRRGRWLTSGMTDAEPDFESLSGRIDNAFEYAMAAKYDRPILDAIYAGWSTNEAEVNNHLEYLDRYDGSKGAYDALEGVEGQAEEVYTIYETFGELLEVDGSLEDGAFTATYTHLRSDNFELSGLLDAGVDDEPSKMTWTTTLDVELRDGIWYITREQGSSDMNQG